MKYDETVDQKIERLLMRDKLRAETGMPARPFSTDPALVVLAMEEARKQGLWITVTMPWRGNWQAGVTRIEGLTNPVSAEADTFPAAVASAIAKALEATR